LLQAMGGSRNFTLDGVVPGKTWLGGHASAGSVPETARDSHNVRTERYRHYDIL